VSQQINLFNPVFLKQKKLFTAVPMAETLGAIVVGVALLTWYASHRVAQLEQVAQEGKTLLAAREQRLAKVNAQFTPRSKDPRVDAELAAAEAELQALRDASSLLQGGALGNTEGYAEYFRAFSRQNVSGLWLTGVTISGAGNEVGVQGRAMQPTLIPHYIARLTGERIMRGKSFASLDIGQPVAQVAAGAAAPAAPPFVEFSLQSTPAKEAGK
jgi:hypothetical protein